MQVTVTLINVTTIYNISYFMVTQEGYTLGFIESANTEGSESFKFERLDRGQTTTMATVGRNIRDIKRLMDALGATSITLDLKNTVEATPAPTPPAQPLNSYQPAVDHFSSGTGDVVAVVREEVSENTPPVFPRHQSSV